MINAGRCSLLYAVSVCCCCCCCLIQKISSECSVRMHPISETLFSILFNVFMRIKVFFHNFSRLSLSFFLSLSYFYIHITVQLHADKSIRFHLQNHFLYATFRFDFSMRFLTKVQQEKKRNANSQIVMIFCVFIFLLPDYLDLKWKGSCLLKLLQHSRQKPMPNVKSHRWAN